jgi:photosystem II stability/assembly factor-like uncharacterized protein
VGLKKFEIFTATMVLTLLLNSSASPQPLPWQQTHAHVGITGVKVVADSQDQLILGTYGNGIYRSSDGGDSWVRGGVPTTHIVSLTVTPNSDIFAGAAIEGIYRSSDGGSTWTSSDSGLTIPWVWALASDRGGYLYAGTGVDLAGFGGGIFRSTDNGLHWEEKLHFDYSYVLSMTVDTQGNIYAGTQTSGLYRSTNRGGDWALVDINRPVGCLASGPTGDVYAGTGPGVFRSTDNGTTWSLVHSSIANSIIVDETGTVYVATNGNGAFRSTDRGISWDQIGLEVSAVGTVFSQTPGLVVFGTALKGLFVSRDNGVSWSPSNQGLDEAKFTTICTDGNGVVFSTEDGYDYSAGILGGTMYRTADAGATWIESGYNRWRGYNCMAAGPSFVVYGTTGVFFTSDGGNSWSNIGLTGKNVASLAVDRFQNILAATSWFNGEAPAGAVYRTTNLGSSWSNLLDTTMVRLVTVSPSGTIFVIRANNLFRSINIGADWTELSVAGVSPALNAMATKGSSQVYMGTDHGVYRSDDNGDSWLPVNSGLTDTLVTRLLVDRLGYLYAATQTALVFQSQDDGGSWHPFSSGLDTRVIYALAGDSSNHIYVASDNGVFRTASPVTTSTSEDDSPLPSILRLEQNYPNPFNPSTSISYELPMQSSVRLSVFDLLGQEVVELVNRVEGPGYYSVEWDASKCSSGVYVYQISVGEAVITRKLLLIR